MDNLVTGAVNNIAQHRANPNFEFIHHDVSNHIHVTGALDWVLHFASPASPIDYLQLPIQTLKVGALGTHNALGVAKAKGAKFMLASTSEVYGDPLVHPQPEEYWGNVNPIGPRGVYDEAKRYAEAITMAYHRHHGVDTRIIRIFNTYGERNRVNDGRVVPTFINQALRGEPLTVFGAGQQTRSFQYVADLVEGGADHSDAEGLAEVGDRDLHVVGAAEELDLRALPLDVGADLEPPVVVEWVAVADAAAGDGAAELKLERAHAVLITLNAHPLGAGGRSKLELTAVKSGVVALSVSSTLPAATP